MELIPHEMHVDFMKYGKWALALSWAIIFAGIYKWVTLGDAKYGIDYNGGYELILKVNPGVSANDIRAALAKTQFQDFTLQAFEVESHEYAVRFEGNGLESKVVRGELDKAFQESLPDKVQVLGQNYVGPTVGKELRRKGIIAFFLSLVAIMIYVTVRFEFAFALGAVVALFHDVIIGVSVYLWLGQVLNMSALAACLTIVGYSVNDTIVIFDRMREDILKHKDMDLMELMNNSINSCFARTIVTSALTFFWSWRS
jgi:preprotein translocase subunit SecF